MSLSAEGDEPAPARPSLREQQRALTRERILSALREVIETRHPLEVTMAAVAERAGVSEPTLYRHFPNKRSLFRALGSEMYRSSTEGVAPTSVDALADFIPVLYHQLAEIEATARWNLVAPKDEAVRPAIDERLETLRAAVAEALAELEPTESDALLRALLLLTSPNPLLYWQDYLGISVEEAAETASWIIRRLATPRG